MAILGKHVIGEQSPLYADCCSALHHSFSTGPGASTLSLAGVAVPVTIPGTVRALALELKPITTSNPKAVCRPPPLSYLSEFRRRLLMNKWLFTIFMYLVLSGCTYSDINFEAMNEDELLEYNRGRSLSQMIVCTEESRSFSRVRRRHCATVEKMYGSVSQAGQLEVLNTTQGFGQ